MGRWSVELSGAEGDLRRVSGLSQPPAWQVRERGGVYVLEADGFAGLADSTAVRAHARDHLVPVINGAARLQFGRLLSGHIDVGAGVMLDDAQGRRASRFVPARLGVQVAATASAMATLTGLGSTPLPPAPAPPSVAEVCTALRHDPQVRRALDFFDHSYRDEWAVNLYRVFEIIRAEVGGDDKALIAGQWATPDELDNFRSVHDPSVAGRHARHGVKGRPSPKNPMVEDQARAFVHRMLERWLRQKHGQLGGAATGS